MCFSSILRLISFLVPVVVCVASTFAHGSDPLPILGGAVAGSYPKAVLASKPVGYWRLDETRGPVAADSSGHKENGQYRGGVTLHLPGAFANDLSAGFDGKTGYVEVPASTAFSVPTSRKGLSVEVWFNPAALKFRGESKDPYGSIGSARANPPQARVGLDAVYSQVSTRRFPTVFPPMSSISWEAREPAPSSRNPSTPMSGSTSSLASIPVTRIPRARACPSTRTACCAAVRPPSTEHATVPSTLCRMPGPRLCDSARATSPATLTADSTKSRSIRAC